MGLIHDPSTIIQVSDLESRFQKLLTLITLLKNARHKSRESELEFLMVNQTFNLVPYRHCVYFEKKGGQIVIKAVSGLVQVDPHGSYVLWLKKVLEYFLKSDYIENAKFDNDGKSLVKLFDFSPSNTRPDDSKEWKSWLSPNALIIAIKNDDGVINSGLLMDRQSPFTDLEKAFVEDLADSYAFVLKQFEKKTFENRTGFSVFSVFQKSRKKMRYALMALVLILLFPVRISATAPAEIVASDPYVITVPFDGTVKEVLVLPGQHVKKGDLLVRMDQTMLQNKSDLAASDKEIADLAYRNAERQGLSDPTKLADLGILKSQIQQKKSEKNFANELLLRADIVANQDGVVIFSDPNALRGKPVQAGEQIMLLADPEKSELLLRVPVDSMISINQNIPPKFFLNILPIGSHSAVYKSIGYQATHDPDGLLTYKIRAKFEKKNDKFRIGWTGLGKVYGDRTILAVNILRRPFVSLRRKMGI